MSLKVLRPKAFSALNPLPLSRLRSRERTWMRPLITTFPSRQLWLGSASLLLLLSATLSSAGSAQPDPASSDQPAPPLASGDTIVLKGPDVYLLEHVDLGRQKGVIRRSIPGRDRLFYKVESNPNNDDLRLMSSLSDLSAMPTEGKSLTVVAAVDQALHFRIFDDDGNMVVDTDEKRLPDQERHFADLKKKLEGLWPPHNLDRRERIRVIGAVKSIFGDATKVADKIRVVSTDDDRHGKLAPDQAIRAAEADTYFTQQIAREPRNANAYWMRARLRLERNDRERARADIDRAIEIEPTRAGLYVTRSMISIRERQFDQVLADCNRAIELDSAESWAYVIRANAWLAKRDYAHALADLNSVARIDSANPLDWSVRFRYWLHVKDRDYADLDKNEGVQLDPNEAITHLWRGDVWCADQDATRAITEYTEAIRLEPANAFAYTRRAAAWTRKHDRENEAADLTTAIQLDPNNATYRVARGASYSARGRHKLAMADYDDALRLDPNNSSIWLARGNERRNHLKLDEAIADYARAIELDPRYAAAYAARGNVWKQREAYGKAIAEFSYLTQLEPENALGHQSLARILATCHDAHYRNGNWALAEAKRACELTNWRDPDCLDTFAAACAEIGDFGSAVKWQTQAIKLVRENVYSLLQTKAVSTGESRGVGFDDRLAFYKSKKPARE
jgi:tetratricopeptide (TPR) repeat protein